jgi:hypothetical protein
MPTNTLNAIIIALLFAALVIHEIRKRKRKK